MSGSRILVIEDDAPLRGLVRIMLERRGHHVQTVVDGSDAIALFDRGEQFTVIIMDLMMPRTSGYELLTFIAERNIATPVFLVTAAGDSFLNKAATGCECVVAILRKPFDVELFTAAVEAVCQEIVTGRLDPAQRLMIERSYMRRQSETER